MHPEPDVCGAIGRWRVLFFLTILEDAWSFSSFVAEIHESASPAKDRWWSDYNNYEWRPWKGLWRRPSLPNNFPNLILPGMVGRSCGHGFQIARKRAH